MTKGKDGNSRRDAVDYFLSMGGGEARAEGKRRYNCSIENKRIAESGSWNSIINQKIITLLLIAKEY